MHFFSRAFFMLDKKDFRHTRYWRGIVLRQAHLHCVRCLRCADVCGRHCANVFFQPGWSQFNAARPVTMNWKIILLRLSTAHLIYLHIDDFFVLYVK